MGDSEEIGAEGSRCDSRLHGAATVVQPACRDADEEIVDSGRKLREIPLFPFAIIEFGTKWSVRALQRSTGADSAHRIST